MPVITSVLDDEDSDFYVMEIHFMLMQLTTQEKFIASFQLTSYHFLLLLLAFTTHLRVLASSFLRF
jgi:hypothetical protein